MHILLTGSSGQLAYDCIEALGSKYQVNAFTKNELNLASSMQVEKILQDINPSFLLNTAAYTKVDRAEQEPDEAYKANVEGPKILAEECHKLGIKLIHISTDYVFDGEKPIPQPYLESDPTNPLGVYGKSKLSGEAAIQNSMDNFIILRTAWLYGIRGHNFLKTILKRALQGAKLKIVNDQFGSLTWTGSLARQIETLLESDAHGLFHASAEGHTTWYEGARYFLKKMNIDAELSPCGTADYPTPAKRPHNSILENQGLKTLGLNAMKSWQEDIDEFVSLYRDRLLAECGRAS